MPADSGGGGLAHVYVLWGSQAHRRLCGVRRCMLECKLADLQLLSPDVGWCDKIKFAVSNRAFAACAGITKSLNCTESPSHDELPLAKKLFKFMKCFSQPKGHLEHCESVHAQVVPHGNRTASVSTNQF